jgi:hypothetical protein
MTIAYCSACYFFEILHNSDASNLVNFRIYNKGSSPLEMFLSLHWRCFIHSIGDVSSLHIDVSDVFFSVHINN